MTIRRILVPIDFSADADVAMQYAIDLARSFGASVDVLHVVENPLAAGMWSAEAYRVEIAGLQINLVRDARERLRKEIARAGALPNGLEHDVRVGHPATTIVDYAREKAVDLIVMGTKGRTGVAHVLAGSVAERVVRTAPCPVLTVRGPRQAEGHETPRAVAATP
jgi:nucleotide-binding universal stress UspA family protein